MVNITCFFLCYFVLFVPVVYIEFMQPVNSCLRLFQISQIRTEENAIDRENQVHDGNRQSSFTLTDKEPKVHMPLIRLASVITRHKRLLVFLSSGVLVILTVL